MKTLYRSRNNRKIAGVCGGIAHYFDVDTTLVRLLWAIACMMYGSGLLLYILAAIIIPEEPRTAQAEPSYPTEPAAAPIVEETLEVVEPVQTELEAELAEIERLQRELDIKRTQLQEKKQGEDHGTQTL